MPIKFKPIPFRVFIHDFEEFFDGFGGIKRTNKAGFPEKEIEMVDIQKLVFECLKCINREICGDNG